jgi:hypothetical protein
MVSLPASFTLKAACFEGEKAVSGIANQYFEKVLPVPGIKDKKIRPGLDYSYYEGQWSKLPDFNSLQALEKGVSEHPGLTVKKQDYNYGLVFKGFFKAPETAVYQFQLTSDDGSSMRIGEKNPAE